MIYKIKKILIFIFLIIFCILVNVNNYYKFLSIFSIKRKMIKICLCTIGKNENKYTREFINHYQKYGVDKIFIYDNNDINGESFYDVSSDYINEKFVEIINFRGKNRIQMTAIKDCYKNNYNSYDWLIFYDMDEFIYLKNYVNIKDYLENKRFEKCDLIHLNLVIHLDNDEVFYKNKSLAERFPLIKYDPNYGQIKSILRGHIPNITIECNHVINHNLQVCDGFGHKKKRIWMSTKEPDYKNYYINHYFWKSTEEYVNKCLRGDVFYGKNKINNMSSFNILRYFIYNKITQEKIFFLANKTGKNITKIIEKLEKKNKTIYNTK